MASREGIPLVRRPAVGLTRTVLHFRSPLGDPRMAIAQRKRDTAARVLETGSRSPGVLKTRHEAGNSVESERESRLRKRNCFAVRRTLARNFPRLSPSSAAKPEVKSRQSRCHGFLNTTGLHPTCSCHGKWPVLRENRAIA